MDACYYAKACPQIRMLPTKEQVKANKYDLSASRYRQLEQDEEFYEEPKVTLERLLTLEQVIGNTIHEIVEAVP